MNLKQLLSRAKTLEIDAKTKLALIDLIERAHGGLVFEDKPEPLEKRLQNETPIFIEVSERAVLPDNEAPSHILIEGDNLHALTCLSFTHERAVDVIYIDPPYNTGNKDFRYNDRYVDKEDGYRHSKWLSFMSKRLRIAKQLLKDTGVIFISIDDNEQAQLKLLCDQIFGQENIETMIWRKSGVGRDGKMKNTTTFRNDHEYVIVAFKQVKALNKSFEKPNWENEYGNPDNDPRGAYKAGSISRKESASNPNHSNYYTVFSPTGKSFTRQFDVSKDKFNELDKDNRIYWGKDKSAVPAIKIFVNEEREVTTSSLIDDKLSTTTLGSKQLIEILQDENIGEKVRPKPVELVRKILQISSKKSALVLDFFAGSGTTMHAVMQLNAEDGGSRQCILVTDNENGIAEEVCYERCKRVIQGYTNARGAQVAGLTRNHLRYYRTGFVEK